MYVNVARYLLTLVAKYIYAGLLTGCAGAGPHNSIKAAQSRTIYENPGNPAQYGKI